MGALFTYTLHQEVGFILLWVDPIGAEATPSTHPQAGVIISTPRFEYVTQLHFFFFYQQQRSVFNNSWSLG